MHVLVVLSASRVLKTLLLTAWGLGFQSICAANIAVIPGANKPIVRGGHGLNNKHMHPGTKELC